MNATGSSCGVVCQELCQELKQELRSLCAKAAALQSDTCREDCGVASAAMVCKQRVDCTNDGYNCCCHSSSPRLLLVYRGSYYDAKRQRLVFCFFGTRKHSRHSHCSMWAMTLWISAPGDSIKSHSLITTLCLRLKKKKKISKLYIFLPYKVIVYFFKNTMFIEHIMRSTPFPTSYYSGSVRMLMED